MIDYLFKYIELKSVDSITTQVVIALTKSIDTAHEVTEEYINDGGSQTENLLWL